MIAIDLLAIAAGEAILTRLRTVTSAMTHSLAVDTLDFNAVHFHLLLRAGTNGMTKLCICVSLAKSFFCEELTIASIALGNTALVRQSSILKTLKILLRGGRPSLLSVATTRVWREEEAAHLVSVIALLMVVGTQYRIASRHDLGHKQVEGEGSHHRWLLS